MPKLTKEEKKQRAIELKAQRMLEAQEAERNIHRDHLARELKYSMQNREKLDKEYRNILMKIKSKDMVAEVETFWRTFENCSDIKDYTISLLLDELDNGKIQHMTNFNAHFENIDKLIALLRERISDLKYEYNFEIDRLTETGQMETSILQSMFKNNENTVSQLIYLLKVDKGKFISKLQEEQLYKLEEEKTKFNENIRVCHFNVESKMKNICTEYENVLKEYDDKTSEKMKLYSQMKKKDTMNNQMFNEQAAAIEKMNAQRITLRYKMLTIKDTKDKQLEDMYAERQYYYDALKKMRNRLRTNQKIDSQKMTMLCKYCEETINYLDNLLKKASKILSLVTICRKFETMDDKIRTFPEFDFVMMSTKKENDSLILPLLTHSKKVERFMMRFGKIETGRLNLLKEKKQLIEENEQIKKAIAGYYESMLYDNATNSEVKRNTVGCHVTEAQHHYKQLL